MSLILIALWSESDVSTWWLRFGGYNICIAAGDMGTGIWRDGGLERVSGYSVVTESPSPAKAERIVCQAKMAHLIRVGYSLMPARVSRSPSVS